MRISITSDGRFAVVLVDGNVTSVDIESGEATTIATGALDAAALAKDVLVLHARRLQWFRESVVSDLAVCADANQLVTTSGCNQVIAAGATPTIVEYSGREPRTRPLPTPLATLTALHPIPQGAIGLESGRLRLHWSARQDYVLPEPRFVEIAGACGLFEGRAVAVHVHGRASAFLLLLARNAEVIRRIEIAPSARVAFSGSRGTAVLATDDRMLLVDLRTGAHLLELPPAPGLAAIACDVHGQGLVVASTSPTGPDVMYLDLTTPPLVVVPATVHDPDSRRAPRSDKPVVVPADVRSPQRADEPIAQAQATRSRRAKEQRRIPDMQLVLSAVGRHAATVYERLLFVARHTGLVPRMISSDDPFAPLVVNDAEVSTVLASFNAPDATDPYVARVTESRERLLVELRGDYAESGLARIVATFNLDGGALDAFVLALAADLDLRWGRLFGFLNNDATRQRPRFGHLTCAASVDSNAGPEALVAKTLVKPGLVLLDATVDVPHAQIGVRVPDHLVTIATTAVGSANHSATWGGLRWADTDRARFQQGLERELRRVARPRLVVLEGPRGSGRSTATIAAALDAGFDAHVCDVTDVPTGKLVETVTAACFRVRLFNEVLIVRSDGVLGRNALALSELARRMSELSVPCVLLAFDRELEGSDEQLRLVRVEVPRCRPSDRLQIWNEAMAERGLAVDADVIRDVAARYTVTAGRVLEVADELAVRKTWTERSLVSISDVRETMREVTAQRLGELARRYETSLRLDDLIFPDSVRARLDELVYRLRHRQQVLGDWAFADKAHEAYGVSVLLSGPSGTGKTAAAAAVANELQIDLYIVDFSRIMSKWVGETEQNLSRVFDEAEASSVALLFDEADALFGKRSSEQRSSSDRYANLTVNYLLQRMESYKGLAILTTNLESAMDKAFQRRITSRIRIPASGQEQRQQLWQHLLPRGAAYADDVDLDQLAAHEMEGANIRRALTRAAFRAAERGALSPVLEQGDVGWAAGSEYEDMGRVAYGDRRS